MVLSCFCQDLSCLFDRFHHVAWGHNFSRVWKTNWRVKRIDICCEFAKKTLTKKLANVRRQVFKRLTWRNVTIDWSWRRKFYESDVIWKSVRVPQRVSPSVVGTDFNPGNINVSSECREVKQKTSRQVWAPVGLIWGPDIVSSKHDVEVGSAVNTVCRGQHEGLRYQWTSTEPGRDNQGDSKNGKQPTTNICG